MVYFRHGSIPFETGPIVTWRILADSAAPSAGDAAARLLGRALDSLLAGGDFSIQR